MTLNWLDITLLVLLAAFVAQGIAQGFTRVAVGLASTVLGILLAAWFYGVAGAFFQPFVSSKAVANIIGFVVIFVGVQLAGALVAWGLSKLFRWSGLSWLDRTLGGVFGALKAALVAIALVMVLTAFPRTRLPHSVARSQFAPYLAEASEVLSYAAPYELKTGFRETYTRLKEFWVENVPSRREDRLDTATF